MASAWGVSWGAYWGNSWGSVATDQPQGGASGKGKRRKRVYIERDGKILLFDNATQASLYLKAVRSPEVVAEKVKKVPEPKVIEIQALQNFVEVKNYEESVYQLLKNDDLEILLGIISAYERWLNEQDEELILLLH